MRIALDTGILVKASLGLSLDHIQVLLLFRSRPHLLLLDHNGDIIKEYRKKAGKTEFFQKWYHDIQSNNKIRNVSGKLPNRIKQELMNRHFHEREDHVFVGVSLNGDRYIISEDSDYGIGDSDRAIDHIDVYEYLTQDVGIQIHCACDACVYLTEVE